MTPDAVSGPPEGGWESLKVDELQVELEARGLPKSGTKAELIARLDAESSPEKVVDAEDADETEDDGAPAPARRRGSPETATATPRRPAGERPDGVLTVSAKARYVRSAPRKARLVMDHIRGKRVEQAQAILQHAPRAVSVDILKLLNSAVANAESSYELGPDELRVRRAFVDEGPTIKRYRPRALGRATRINKRTSHMTIELTTEGNGR